MVTPWVTLLVWSKNGPVCTWVRGSLLLWGWWDPAQIWRRCHCHRGQTRGCTWPSRWAFADVLAALHALSQARGQRRTHNHGDTTLCSTYWLCDWDKSDAISRWNNLWFMTCLKLCMWPENPHSIQEYDKEEYEISWSVSRCSICGFQQNKSSIFFLVNNRANCYSWLISGKPRGNFH